MTHTGTPEIVGREEPLAAGRGGLLLRRLARDGLARGNREARKRRSARPPPASLDGSVPRWFFLSPAAPRRCKRATMKLSVALAVLVLVWAQALAEELGDNDELGYFSDWSDGDPSKDSGILLDHCDSQCCHFHLPGMLDTPAADGASGWMSG
uniref:Uncharacterized protein n=1 Tax=Sphaerodactylus townsendi TaxID=933632 RepID=A0ACB8FVK5_9SAUR